MEKIAVVGMACRYPGANNIDDFWQNLIDGKETISFFTNDVLSRTEYNYEELKKNTKYVPARGILEGVDMFDANFFGFSPSEAANTDPQHRIWLETVWDAFENAGCDPFCYKGAIGVFAGGYINTYLLNNILRDPEKMENYIRLRTTESFQVMTGNDIAYLPTKTAYKFNLKGPAINVQTACSTSLVAISQACQSLFSFESDMCIAGGICVSVPQETGYIYQEGAIPSPDGHCRPFDAKANGTVFSNGVGVVVLKRLEDAIADRDNIYAVVDGWALNNDGNKKVSYTAPSIDGQAEAILMAQSFNEISPENISYIEAHGTGTNLGDPIEVAALTKAFSRSTSKKQFCGIGSLKSNIGHTDAAAGVASFMKICLAAYHRIIPKTLHFESPNPHIDFANSPFYVVDKNIEWNRDEKLIMGVSSFGIGGTNAHIIIEEPPRNVKLSLNTNRNYIIPLSAKTSSALDKRIKNFIDFCKDHQEYNLDDLLYTLWNGRNHMKHRATAIIPLGVKNVTDGVQFERGSVDEKNSSLAFLFPGQGAQFFKMGYELYRSNDRYKSLVNHGCDILKNEVQIDLIELLFESDNQELANEKLAETSITQPALFIVEYSLAKLLTENNIIPKYLIGHSIGEYAAACIAGVFDYDTALRIVIKRGQLMQQMKPGKMFAALSNKDKLLEISDSMFEIAAENAPNSCTISFETENYDMVCKILDSNEIAWIPLNTSHAYHSKSFDPMLNEFAEYVNQFYLSSPAIPVISCYTGVFLTADQATSGNYWANQLRNTVKFYNGIKTILDKESVLFVEVGPNTHLNSILRVIPEFENKKAVVTTLGRPENVSEPLYLEKIVGNIWSRMDFDIMPFVGDFLDAKKVVLPNYPFERERHWIEYKVQKNNRPHIQCSNVINTQINDVAVLKNEDELIKIWAESMGLKEINSDDNFFDIGGSSLLALSISERIEKKFNVPCNLRIFLEYPTIASFVSYIERVHLSIKENAKDTEVKESKIIWGEI
ncbi:MAG: acyltransferase domain-containing protein [Marinilabiliaceae bacterium]|nr:acyltransferase domain-containing protein [Marinilabiliaceae bacterium]